MKETHESGTVYEHSLDHALELFSKGGSLFSNREGFYEGSESALSLFQKSWIIDKPLTLKLLLWLRDCRGGAANRSGSRECYHWLANHEPEWLAVNIKHIPEVGRWDDLRPLFGTPAEKAAVELWATALKNGDVLAAKWADRSDKPLRKALGMEIGTFRRFLARLRKNHIVEHKMCTKRWNEIEYPQVPSVAMARYTKAFGKNDEKRFELFKEALEKGEVEIHAGVLFPHDCVRTSRNGDRDIADAQFNALPNFLEGTNEKIIVIADTSYSMTTKISGEIRAVDISQGLALYCSTKIPENNPFYKKFVAFESESEFKNWEGMEFSEAIRDQSIFDEAVGSTRIDTALDLILDTARFFNVTNDQMPTTLLIVSDMQFHEGCHTEGDGAEVENCLLEWDKSGYNRPKIVYWNTDGYTNSPTTAYHKDVGMISGFSPAILQAVLSGTKFDPLSIMMRALEKYEINTP